MVLVLSVWSLVDDIGSDYVDRFHDVIRPKTASDNDGRPYFFDNLLVESPTASDQTGRPIPGADLTSETDQCMQGCLSQ